MKATKTLQFFYQQSEKKAARITESYRVREARRLIRALRRHAKKSPFNTISFYQNVDGYSICKVGIKEFKINLAPDKFADDLSLVESYLNKEGFYISSFTSPIHFSCD